MVRVVKRSADTINSELQTGEIEVNIESIRSTWNMQRTPNACI